ncbi:MAG: hypothetical protein HYU28_09330 [Actinobacteria bacterium]|nr:hypothetical protein [Actinomycetota bacterium]
MSRRPDWEAAFLIALLPDGSWAKVQVFGGPRTPGRHCLSAVEGMDTEPEVLLIEASPAEVRVERSTPDRSEFEFSLRPWVVRAPGLDWTGEVFRELTLKAQGIEAVARPNPSDVLRWIGLPGLLTYWTAFAALTWNGEPAVGLVERAWGAQTRMPVGRLARRPWRWDVLVTGDLRGFAAELRLDLGRGLVPVRAGARLPGGDRVRTGRSLRALGLDYEAHQTTPVAEVLDSGGFVGTSWEGSVAGSALTGVGFREYGGGR